MAAFHYDYTLTLSDIFNSVIVYVYLMEVQIKFIKWHTECDMRHMRLLIKNINHITPVSKDGAHISYFLTYQRLVKKSTKALLFSARRS